MPSTRPFGSVRQRGRLYEASYWHNGRRHIAPTSFTNKGDARAFLSAVETDIRRGVWIDPWAGRLKVSELAQEWTASNPNKRESTTAREELTLRLHVLPAIGELRIERVGPRDIQRLVNSWRAEHAPRTVKRNYEVVRAMFGYAVRNDWLARNPCRNVNLPPVEGTRRFDLTPEDVAAIAAHVSEEYRPMIWIGAALGLRWSEVAALRVGRLDLDAGRLAVAEALVRGTGGRNVFGPPKSKAGQRTMFMPKVIVAMLSAHLERAGFTRRRHRRARLHRRGGWAAALLELAPSGLAPGRLCRRLCRRRLPRPAPAERHHARRRRDRREDGADPTRPRRPEDDTGRLRLRSGVNRSGRSGRHWRALLRRKGQKGRRHEISAPLPRQSFRGVRHPGILRP